MVLRPIFSDGLPLSDLTKPFSTKNNPILSGSVKGAWRWKKHRTLALFKQQYFRAIDTTI
jgi:hypothetical protein